jgi:hypothetical protein
MQDLAMIALELLQNSLAAEASKIDFTVKLDQPDGSSQMIVKDNGKGMDEALLKKVSSPFTTSRTTRKVGLGVAFFTQAITQADGAWSITSHPGEGTTISARWKSDHWDAPPIGNLGEAVMFVLQSHPNLQLNFNFDFNSNTYRFDSKVLESAIAPVPLSELAILHWIENEINTNIQHCKGGIDHEES